MEPVSDGPVSKPVISNPSKPYLLYATLPINGIPLSTLIDTGASITCISISALQQLSHAYYIDQTPCSISLADGVPSLRISGVVELFMQLGNEMITFHAFVTEKLCIDLILGMDFMILVNANIDIQSQQFSVTVAGRRTTITVDDSYRRPLVPLYSCSAVDVFPHSTVRVPVSSPISSISAYFIPTSTFLEHSSLSSSQTTITIHQHHSFLLVSNSSDFSQHIPAQFCFGYLLSYQVDQLSFSAQVSALCQPYNEKKNQELRLRTHAPFTRVPDYSSSSLATCPTSSLVSSTVYTDDLTSVPLHLQHTLDRLVHHLVDTSRTSLLSTLLVQYSTLFDNSRHNVSDIVIENVFNTVPHTPPAFRPHRNPLHQHETQRLIDEFLEAGIIQESNSPYAAPGFIVPRKDNRPGRLVIDYRALNKITIPYASPLPHGEDLLQELGKGYTYFSKLDLKSGYHQFRIPVEDCPKTPFVVSQGHYEFLVLSMGPQNAPAGFQKIMSRILKPCRHFCQVFLDDIILYSKTFEEHLSHLRLAFETLAKAKLVLNASKCELAVEQVTVFNHVVSETFIAPTNDAIQAILDLPEPRTLKEANRFVGGLAYYRKFVPHFSRIAAPIYKVTNLTKAKRHLFQWNQEQSAAFHMLKDLLTSAPIFLRFPVDDFPLQLCTDASGIATGGVSYQDINGVRHNLFCHSKVMSPVEQRYSAPEKEALAILHCLQRMRTLILGRTVYIHTDHCPICGMLQKPVNNRRIERVANLIQEYHIAEMKHIEGKNNCLADYLSRPLDDPLFDIPYGLESKLPVAVLVDSMDTTSSTTPLLSAMTLRPRRKASAPSSSVLEDAAQLEISDASLLDSPSSDTLPLLSSPSPNVFDYTTLRHEQSIDSAIRLIFDELSAAAGSVSQTHSSLSFVLKYGLVHRLVSPTRSAHRNIAVPYLPASMITPLLVAMHDDLYQGGHFSSDKMFSKIRSRYWWPNMRSVIHQHVKACTCCQQYNYSREKKPGHLHSTPPPSIPFSVLGMDFCGPFVESPEGNKYILVITDLFTRFVTAIPLPRNTADLTALTLFRHIFCKYGVCSTLITDQGSHFNNHLMQALTHLIGYNHIYSTPYHPQSNGIVERFNASMVAQLSKLYQKHHNNWDSYVDPVVFAYNISQHRSTSYSPFELLFGRSPLLPIDPPPRSFSFARSDDSFVHLQRLLQSYHHHARVRMVSQQEYSKRRYDKNRRDPHFNLGDRVFTRIFSSRGKLDPRFSNEPQYIVRVSHPTYTVRHDVSGNERQYHVSDLRPVMMPHE